MRRRVVVTGVGVLSPLGDSPAALHAALCEGARAGASHLLPVEGFAVEGLPMGRAVELRGFDPARYLGEGNFRPLDRTGLLAACAARLALDDAGWSGDAVATGEVALLVGTMYGSLRTIAEFDRRGLEAGPLYVKPFDFANSVINAAAGQTAIWHHLRGPNSTVCAGTASGVQAIALGADLVAEGRVEVAVAGGAEELCWESFLAFSRAGMVANGDGTPRPFDAQRSGFALGEGAAFLVLESAEGAAARGAHVLAEVLGHGAAFDPSQGTDEKSSAAAVARAVKLALAHAGLQAEDVSAVSAAASGHRHADAAEARGLAAALGMSVASVGVTAPKGALGECLGASGGLQAAALVAAMEAGELPGTAGFTAGAPGFPLWSISNATTPVDLAVGLVDGVGLDGPCCALLLGRS
ncbi:MAG TPA: beta-ketoacyl synthase N-terminal-like domain-containing protein [Thermoanaerobaculia bacterium]|nr:beta-ketoacyl synthase N-terminal-like domain-containing protein [Thermoanaerobaculia bacterium]